jgi:putative ABC transport system permease protein
MTRADQNSSSSLRFEQSLRLSWRWFLRDFRSGGVRVLFAAIALAVCAVSAVSFLSDRAQRAMALQANQLLGGDALIKADAPIGPAQRALAGQLQQAEVLSFNSMLRAGSMLKLADIKAISQGFPLRGAYQLADANGKISMQAGAWPKPGQLWLSGAGAQALAVKIGDKIALGALEFEISALIVQEPDAALSYFNVAPRAIIRLDDLAKTQLIQEGSRVVYRLVVAGAANQVAAFSAQVQPTLKRGQQLETVQDARPELRQALERANQFLGLSALVAVVLAAVAAAMAARRHTARHIDGCAVMRAIGASSHNILQIYLGQLFWVGLFAAIAGVMSAFALQALAASLLAKALQLDIPAASALPALEGFAVGFVVLMSFAAPPVLALKNAAPLRVLRKDLPSPQISAWLALVLGLAGLAGLIVMKAGSVELGLTILAGLAATLFALALLAFALIAGVHALRGRLRGPLRYGLANISRRASASAVQTTALGLGLMVIMLLTLVRGDLLNRWQAELPDDAPNRFVIGLQAEQTEPFSAAFQTAGLAKPKLFPMIQARFVQQNDQAITQTSFAEQSERAQRLAERNFNVSYMAELPADNEIVAGKFWGNNTQSAEFSVEVELAKSLGWNLGDTLAFDVAGQRLEAKITSFRKVDWGNFQPNFFVIASPSAARELPQSFMTSLHLPSEKFALTNELVQQMPNISVIDVDAILAQVRRTSAQAAAAISWVFYFTLAAGVLVLIGAMRATQDERLREAAIMRVLGASTTQLRLAQLSEFTAQGVIAGGTAAIAANVLSGVIAEQILGISWRVDPMLMLVGTCAGVLAVVATGLITLRSAVTLAPAQSLRALEG